MEGLMASIFLWKGGKEKGDIGRKLAGKKIDR
jgi:hypothetical protein